MPGATLEQLRLAERAAARVVVAARRGTRCCARSTSIDVSDSRAAVRCPTLVLHARGDLRVPFEEGRAIASTIPGARFVPLETDNHILLEHEPAFAQFFDELHAFLPRPAPAAPSASRRSPRARRKILELHRAGPRQRADRRAPGAVGEDGAQPHHQHLRQDRRREPRAGDRPGARAAAWDGGPSLSSLAAAIAVRDLRLMRRAAPSRHHRAAQRRVMLMGITRFPVRHRQLPDLPRRLPVRRSAFVGNLLVPKTIDSGAPAGAAGGAPRRTCCCSACSPCSTA